MRFERNAFAMHQTLVHANSNDRSVGRAYEVVVQVPHYEDRCVRIEFSIGSKTAKVTVDGPTGSDHRYSDGSLCMWYPADPPSQKWVWTDRLPQLLLHVQLHLFREAWCREFNVSWPGPESPHAPPNRQNAA